MTQNENSLTSAIDNELNTPGTKKPWLSILIPVYNVEEYLEECLQSILRQWQEGIEILMVDDASSDNSFKLAQDIAKTAPTAIKVYCNRENEGVSNTRQFLLDKAQGKYIWFVDSDDCLYPGAIAAVKKAISEFEPDIIGCDYRRRYETGRWRKIMLQFKVSGFHGPRNQMVECKERMLEGLFKSRKMYLWLKIFKRSLWTKDIRFPAGKHFEDIATTPWVTLSAKNYYHIPKALLRYRIRQDSIMGTVRRKNQPFDEKRHWEFAEAYRGYPEALRRTGIPTDGATGYAISHCIGTEYSKLAGRIRGVAHLDEGEREEAQDKLCLFYDHMNASAPIPFPELLLKYRRKGIFWRYLTLKKNIDCVLEGQK